MKKILPILLSLCLLLTLVSCAVQTPPAPDDTTAETTQAAADETATADETEAGTEHILYTTADLTTLGQVTGNVALNILDRDLDALTTCNAVDDPQTAFVIAVDRAVSGLQILSLYEASFGDDGQYTFSRDAVYSQDSLTPDAPLVVNTTFYGDTPNIGIRYIDTDGSEKTYAIDVSGMDGSLYLLALEGGSAQ